MELYIGDLKVEKGMTVEDFRERKVKVLGWREPLHESSTGRVIVELESGQVREFFPGVINAKWK